MKIKAKKSLMCGEDRDNSGKKRFCLDIIILSAIMLLTMILPYASYTYRKVTYTLSGLDFIAGKAIAGGKVTVRPNTIFCIAVLAIIFILIGTLIVKKINMKLYAALITIFGVIAVICNICFVAKLDNLLQGVKNTCISYGSIIYVVAGCCQRVIYSLEGKSSCNP